MIRTSRTRAVCALAIATVAAACSPGLMRPQAATGLTISVGTCHNLDPAVTQNSLTAVRSDDRPWDQIRSVQVTTGPSITANTGGFTVSYDELDVAITTCATAFPTFPTVSGDVGAQWLACFDPGTTMPIAVSSNGVLIGHGTGGVALYDGPYPTNQGFRFCGWASQYAAMPADYGVAVYDPTGGYAEYDRADLVDSTLSTSTITPASWTPSGSGAVVNLYVPYDWVVTTQTKSGNFTTVDPILSPGVTVTDFVAQTQAGPLGVVQPASTHCTPGVQVQPAAACTPAASGLQSLTPVDWAPGSEWCVAASTGCAMYSTGGFANGYDLGVDDVKSHPAATVVTVNPSQPCLGTAGSCVTNQPPSYFFDYGRFLNPVSSMPPFSATRRYLADGASFVA